MAWQNVILPNLNCGITSDTSYCETSRNKSGSVSEGNYPHTNTFSLSGYSNAELANRFIYGDTTLGFQTRSPSASGSNRRVDLYLYLNGNARLLERTIDISTGSGVACNWGLFFFSNDTTQRGTLIITSYATNSGEYQYRQFYNGGHYNDNGIYQFITQAIPPLYNWVSVPSISGKNGISLLSIIKSSAINSGDAVSGASADAFNSLESTSKLSTLASGKTEETPIIYSDDENYMAIKDNGDNTCDLRFYLEGQSLLKIQNASQNAYLSMLEDDTNQVVKPSIIYKSGNTYSYNTESPSLDTMENLYNWLHIQTRKKENKTGRWSTSFTFSRVEE